MSSKNPGLETVRVAGFGDPIQELVPHHDSVLLEAEGLINGDRAKAYGPPEDNYRRISNMLKASEKPRVCELTPDDIAYVMIITKLARESNSHKRDNSVDGAAYFDIYERLVPTPENP